MTTLEQFFTMSDPLLRGVELGARVQLSDKEGAIMGHHLVIRYEGRDACIECVHIIIATLPTDHLPSDATGWLKLAQTSEQRPAILAPEEHFFALRSYAQGIAEVGLGNLFAASLEYPQLPVGFNAQMQAQFLSALTRVGIPQAAIEDLLAPTRGAILAAPPEWRLARLRAGILTGFIAYLHRDLELSGTNLAGAQLSGANLAGADLMGANLFEADLSFANLCQAGLEGANLEGSKLINANLQGTNLVRANLSRANLFLANLQTANLEGANMYRTLFTSADLRDASFKGANLLQADFMHADLRRANLRGATLRGACLIGANFAGANFEGADKTGVKY